MSTEFVAKFHPGRFPNMSPKMAAITGFLLGQEYTTPQIVGMVVTSDKFVLAQTKGDYGHNEFIGTYEDLEKNWHSLVDLIFESDELPEKEITYYKNLLKTKIQFC